MTLEKGQIINQRYRIVSLLGQGGFGAVYRVWDINLNRACALKENLELSEDARRQFEREAQILANLNHPGLPRVTDHFLISDQGQYLVMDYIEGDDLHQVMKKAVGPLPESQALGWILQVCDALHYLHTHQPPVIHRDIKPANIKITPQGRAVLVDFGIAKIYDPNLRTTSGARAVTPGFSPPEQYGQGQTDAQSDVYALGATLYNLLTGMVPPDSVDIVAGNTNPPPPVSVLNPGVSPTVNAAVMRAMHTNRSSRLRSMREFQAALQGRLSLPPEPVTAQATQVAPAAGTLPVSPGTPAYPTSDKKAIKDARPSESSRPPSRPSQPPAKPASRSVPWIAILAGVGLLGVVGIAVLVGAYSWLTAATSTPDVTEKINPRTETRTTEVVIDTLPAASLEPSKIPPPSAVPPPSATPTPSEPLFALPQSRLAFVSDHRMDGKERISVIDVVGGNYTKGQIVGLTPFSTAQVLPALEPYDMAWWPDWCGGNQTIFFEAQDMDDAGFQAVAFVPSSGGSAASLSLPGLGKLGVPRCSHGGNQVMLSALTNSDKNLWGLYRYDMASQSAAPVGSGYSLAGYSSWARDDSWLVYMDRNSKNNFYLVRLWLGSLGTEQVNVPASVEEQKYPAVSPANGDVAFACYENAWNLCRVDQSLGSYQVLLYNLIGETKRAAPRRTVPAVTPTWSPDGVWIAYASNKDGDWDIYLYSPVLEIEVNLTDGLGGDQFQPAWSKP